MGRPRKADRPAMMARVCSRVASGELVKDAATAEGTTAKSIREWAAADAALGALYAHAREGQAHAIAEEAVAIADEEAESTEEVQRNRLRVDTRKWLASKIAPRDYGDRIQQDVTLDITNGLAEKLAAARKRVANG